MPDFDNNLTGSFARLWVHNVVDGNFAFKLTGASAIHNLDFGRVVKRLQDCRIFAVLRVHCPQKRQRGKLAALINSNGQKILLGRINFDPTTTLGNHAATRQFPVGSRICFPDEVNSRTSMQLTDHHALGTIDDKLTTAKHDWDITKENLFLDRLLFLKTQPNPKRLSVSHS